MAVVSGQSLLLFAAAEVALGCGVVVVLLAEEEVDCVDLFLDGR